MPDFPRSMTKDVIEKLRKAILARNNDTKAGESTHNEIVLFISHSHSDREIASTIKKALEHRFGLKAFVAHEDINPSEEWQHVILDELKKCDILLAILSKAFKDSFWTDQEIGVAISLDKVILPVKIDIDPYGFIGKYQAFKWTIWKII